LRNIAVVVRKHATSGPRRPTALAREYENTNRRGNDLEGAAAVIATWDN
jgi:hypothetical protein